MSPPMPRAPSRLHALRTLRTTPPAAVGSAPAQPQGLEVGSATGASLTADWLPAAGATGYVLERSPDGLAGWTAVFTGAALTDTDSGLSASTTYYYRVKATNAFGASPYSLVASGATQAGTGPPAVPTGLAATAYPNGINLSWPAVTGATSYEIDRSANGGTTWTLAGYSEMASFLDYGAGSGFGPDGLAANSAFLFRIRSVGPGGTSANSAALAASTTGTVSRPAIGLSLTAAPDSPTSTRVGWEKGSGSIIGYVLSRRADPGAQPIRQETLGIRTQIADQPNPSIGTGMTPFIDSGRTPNTRYLYDVRCYGPGGISPGVTHWTPYSATTPVAGEVGPSPGLWVWAIDETTVGVTWLPVVGATGYILERSSDGGSTWTTIFTGAANSFTDSGRTAGATYAYRFSAPGAWGGSTTTPSVTVSRTTPAVVAGRRLLRPGDFTYLGSFLMPVTVNGGTVITAFSGGGGMALRYVSGQLRLMMIGEMSTVSLSNANVGCPMYEVTPPAQGTWVKTAAALKASGAPTATEARYWGPQIYGGKRLQFINKLTAAGSITIANLSTPADYAANQPFVADEYDTRGMCWDEATKTLYITIGEYYNVNGVNQPCLLAATIDDAGGTVTGHGPWRISRSGTGGTPHAQKVCGGSLKIPQWWADANLGAGGTRCLALGFGGNMSGTANGSQGPAYFAVSTSALTDAAACQVGQVGTVGVDFRSFAADAALQAPTVPTTCLLSYPDESTGDPNNVTSRRPPGLTVYPYFRELNYGTEINGGQGSPSGGYGRWEWTDNLRGGSVWIDDDAGTRGKHGVFVGSWFGFGQISYKAVNCFNSQNADGSYTSGGNSEDGGSGYAFAVVDPADLAAVAAGGPTSAPQLEWWPADFAGADGRKAAYRGDYKPTSPEQPYISGAAFDPATNLLYLCQSTAIVPFGRSARVDAIHVYQVAN